MMKINEEYSLEMVCCINAENQDEVEEVFDNYEEAAEFAFINNRPLEDIYFAYIVIDSRNEIPEECKLCYPTPKEAIEAVIQ